MFSDAATGLACMAHILSHRAADAHTVRARRSPLAREPAAQSIAQLAPASPTCRGSSATRTPQRRRLHSACLAPPRGTHTLPACNTTVASSSAPTCLGSPTTSMARVVHTRSVDATTARVVRARHWPSVRTLATDKHERLAPASQTPATAQSRQPTCLCAPSMHSLACLVV